MRWLSRFFNIFFLWIFSSVSFASVGQMRMCIPTPWRNLTFCEQMVIGIVHTICLWKMNSWQSDDIEWLEIVAMRFFFMLDTTISEESDYSLIVFFFTLAIKYVIRSNTPYNLQSKRDANAREKKDVTHKGKKEKNTPDAYREQLSILIRAIERAKSSWKWFKQFHFALCIALIFRLENISSALKFR